MKLRLKVEPKDLMIFCVFSFVWLIVVQLLVINVNAFVQEEPFTINIFLVFTNGVMFLMTIALFLLGIIIGLVSVVVPSLLEGMYILDMNYFIIKYHS